MINLAHNRLIKIASYLSVVTSLIILGAKTMGWLVTDAPSILASLIDSLLDVSSSLINLIAVRVALQPPDNNHRFGHEKFQDLAIFSQSMFFFASSIFTFFSSLRFLGNHGKIINPASGLNIMYFCIVLTSMLVLYQSYVIKKTRSNIIAADKLHYFSDLLTNIAVVISIYFSSNFWFLDALVGIGISLFIMQASYKLFRQAVRNLADEELPDKDKEKILLIISKHPKIKGVHDLKTRHAANKSFIQFHLELDGDMTLLEAHNISDQISTELLVIFPEGEITIHQDPEGIEEEVSYREELKLL